MQTGPVHQRGFQVQQGKYTTLVVTECNRVNTHQRPLGAGGQYTPVRQGQQGQCTEEPLRCGRVNTGPLGAAGSVHGLLVQKGQHTTDTTRCSRAKTPQRLEGLLGQYTTEATRCRRANAQQRPLGAAGPIRQRAPLHGRANTTQRALGEERPTHIRGQFVQQG